MKSGIWMGTVLALVFGAVTAQADEAPTPVVQPRLEVRETAFNFGYVPQGYSISHVFWLRNAGSDTLRITDVRPG